MQVTQVTHGLTQATHGSMQMTYGSMLTHGLTHVTHGLKQVVTYPEAEEIVQGGLNEFKAISAFLKGRKDLFEPV